MSSLKDNYGDSMDKFDYYFRVLERYDQYINLANTKASNHITLLGTLAIAATALVGWGLNLDTTRNFIPNGAQTFLILTFIVYIICSLYWYLTCMAVIQPNTKGSKGSGIQIKSSIFYGDVDTFSNFNDFKLLVDSRSEQEHFEDLINQIHVMAHITNQKFLDYKKVNKWVGISFVLLLVILLVSIVIRLG